MLTLKKKKSEHFLHLLTYLINLYVYNIISLIIKNVRKTFVIKIV